MVDFEGMWGLVEVMREVNAELQPRARSLAFREAGAVVESLCEGLDVGMESV